MNNFDLLKSQLRYAEIAVRYRKFTEDEARRILEHLCDQDDMTDGVATYVINMVYQKALRTMIAARREALGEKNIAILLDTIKEVQDGMLEDIRNNRLTKE